jgi:serine/threonine protein kinase
VLEYLEGASLEKSLSDLDMGKLLEATSEALEALHQAGLVHRDIKPANLFLTREGRVVLTDFGLIFDPRQTHLTRTNAMVGSLGFLGPDILQGEPSGPAQDWWALGVTMFALVERRLPFETKDLMASMSGRPLSAPVYDKLAPEDPLRKVIVGLLHDPPEQLLTCWRYMEPSLYTLKKDAGTGETTEVRSAPETGREPQHPGTGAQHVPLSP